MQEARECLLDAKEVHSEEGGTVEPGIFFFVLQRHIANVG